MSLTSSLLIGRSALSASQIAIQVTGDNLANAATPGYSRRVASFAPVSGSINAQGLSFGRGVEVESIRRQIDPALIARVRESSARTQAANVSQDILSQIESVIQDLSGTGLGSELNEFFNTFSELANNPSASETRSLIVEQGSTLSGFIRRLRSDLIDLRSQVDNQINSGVERADELLSEVASLNQAITQSEQGRTEDASLRDQRDEVLRELSTLIDISVIEKPSGAVDVYAWSTPIVIGTSSRGLETQERTVNGELVIDIIVTASQDKIEPKSGRIGGLLDQRNGSLKTTLTELDDFSSNLIFQINRVHSSGRSFPGLTDTTGVQSTLLADQTLAFNDPTNTTFAGLPFSPENGSFSVTIIDETTGQTQSFEIFVDLDGIDNTGAPGFADDTTLASLVADLNAVANLNAQITPTGEVRLFSDTGFQFGFENDTSGALATLGINTFFSGTDSSDIAVRQELIDNPLLLVAGLSNGSNETALSIAQLRETPIDSLGGVSLTEAWRRTTDRIAVETRGASTRAQAAQQVQSSLEAQQAAISGVSIDEESINLLNYQRQYQAAARFIATVDELTQILISLV